jgi:hypothetical protein
MFAKTIIDSDAFLEMPLSSQALYFHLGMRGDDDGFINNPKKIQRTIGASDDDFKLLIAKRFIIPFESGVVVVKHWKIHNYIQKDRYKETVYQDEKNTLITKENGSYSLVDTGCIQNGYSLETQVRLGKDRLELGKNRDIESTSVDPPPQQIPYDEIVSAYNVYCCSLRKVRDITDKRKKAIKARWNTHQTMDWFEDYFKRVEQSNFLKGGNDRNWTADFDWLMNENNMVKVTEGKYDNKGQPGQKQSYTDKLKEWANG